MLYRSSDFTDKFYDVFEHFPIQSCLLAFGLTVKKEYRRNGIAVKLLKNRVPLLKHLGLNVTSTTFSSLSAQKAAIKAGFKETFAISYEKIQEEFPNFDFSQADSTHCKYFVLEISGEKNVSKII